MKWIDKLARKLVKSAADEAVDQVTQIKDNVKKNAADYLPVILAVGAFTITAIALLKPESRKVAQSTVTHIYYGATTIINK